MEPPDVQGDLRIDAGRGRVREPEEVHLLPRHGVVDENIAPRDVELAPVVPEEDVRAAARDLDLLHDLAGRNVKHHHRGRHVDDLVGEPVLPQGERVQKVRVRRVDLDVDRPDPDVARSHPERAHHLLSRQVELFDLLSPVGDAVNLVEVLRVPGEVGDLLPPGFDRRDDLVLVAVDDVEMVVEHPLKEDVLAVGRGVSRGEQQGRPEQHQREKDRSLHRIVPSVGLFRAVYRATASYHSGLTTLSFIQSFIARVQSAFQSGLL